MRLETELDILLSTLVSINLRRVVIARVTRGELRHRMSSRRGDGERCSVTACRLGAVMRVRGVPREMALLCDSLYGRVDLVIVTMCTVCLYGVVLTRVAVHDLYRYDTFLTRGSLCTKM